MPDWNELTALLAQHAQTPSGLSAPMVAARYEERFGRVQLIETIRDALHPDKAKPGRAHRAFVRLPFDTVYTTNFDLLLEAAYSEDGRPSRSLAGEQQLPFHAGQAAASIIKMHGDLRHEEHIVITQNDYDQFLTRYPVVATHLSAMLITRTPLFIGYSLSDPDFNSIRDVVRSRLGPFTRMAYVVQFDADSDTVEAGYKQNLHIISVPTNSHSSRDEALEGFFSDLQSALDTRSGVDLRTSRPDIFETVKTEVLQSVVHTPEQSPVLEATSRLCFVMMPFNRGRSDEVYRTVITPAVQSLGLSPIRADEMTGAGFIMEQIRTAIQQSRLCVADITGNNPNVLYEIGLAHAIKKPLVLLAEEGALLPFDIAQQRIILYGPDLTHIGERLRNAMAVTLASRLPEAAQLFELKHYRPAIAAAAIALEQRLNCLYYSGDTPTDLQRALRAMSMGRMLQTLAERGAVTKDQRDRLENVIVLRNRAVHTTTEPLSKADAEFVLVTTQHFLEETASAACP